MKEFHNVSFQQDEAKVTQKKCFPSFSPEIKMPRIWYKDPRKDGFSTQNECHFYTNTDSIKEYMY